jgi:hypothetical protein
MNILVLKNAAVIDCDGQTPLPGLILVRREPLKQIKLFQDYQDRITMIIQGGRIHKHLV